MNDRILGGMDFMISAADRISRRSPEGGNFFSVLLTMNKAFDFECFRLRLTGLTNPLTRFFAGSVRRPLFAPPRWCEGRTSDAAVFDCAVRHTPPADFLSEPMPSRSVIRAAWFPESSVLVFKFSHRMFDGSGAEILIRRLLSGERSADSPDRPPPEVSWDEIREEGRKLRAFMKELSKRKIAVLPCSRSTPARFQTIRLSREEMDLLRSDVESRFGPFTFSMVLFSSILLRLELVLKKNGASGDTVMIPMSVDARTKTDRRDSAFFNHWSILPLLVPRSALHSLPDAFHAVRAEYIRCLGANVPEMFRKASYFMRYVPWFVVEAMMNHSRAATAGTMMFSYIDSDFPFECVENVCHCPVMPPVNPLGFFANVCKGQLNVTVSHRMETGTLAEDFRKSLRELRKH